MVQLRILLVGALCVLSVWAQVDKAAKPCRDAISACSTSTLTGGRCRTLWWGFQLDMNRNDNDIDCQATGNDYSYDVSAFYDTNGDGMLCKNEWSDRRTSYAGFTRAATDYAWDNYMGRGQNCVPSAAFSGAPASDLKSEFSTNNIERRVAFCNVGNNMMTNRDCYGLSTVCKYKRPQLDACSSFDAKYFTLYEKLMSNRVANDANGDGLISREELQMMWMDTIDTNSDGCVSKEEWTNRWTIDFQFSTEFSEYEFDYTDVNKDGCINSDDLNEMGAGGQDGSGRPASEVQKSILGRLIDMCEADMTRYNTVSDCAQLAETCITYFPTLEKCKIFVDNCGLTKYTSCLANVDTCVSEDDKVEVWKEMRRIENQQMDGLLCKPYVMVEECDDSGAGALVKWSLPFTFIIILILHKMLL